MHKLSLTLGSSRFYTATSRGRYGARVKRLVVLRGESLKMNREEQKMANHAIMRQTTARRAYLLRRLLPGGDSLDLSAARLGAGQRSYYFRKPRVIADQVRGGLLCKKR